MSAFALAKVNNVRISGISAAVPSHAVDNAAFGGELYGEEIEGVIKTTGVRCTSQQNLDS